mmetsp:Transcript_31909/g.54969  ORF Transcript_31909/g.54969 Transcript_31909/m.54969 type:complete len:179 (+) Transcript_31909:263-799(+)
MRCAQLNSRCPTCQKVIKTSELDAHIQEAMGTVSQLFEFAQKGDLKGLEFSLAHGTPIEVTDAHGNTLMHAAAKFGHPALVQFLANRGLDVNKLNQFGEAPLHLAVSTKTHRNIEVVQVLLGLSADSSTPSSLGDSPLRKGYSELAQRHGFLEAVMALNSTFRPSSSRRPASRTRRPN